MKNLLLLIFLMASCTTIEKPTTETTPTDEIKTDARKEIYKIVNESTSCSKYYWKNRGYAEPEYMNGMALMYAKQVCGNGTNFIKQNKSVGTYKLYSGSYPYKDALAYYGISGSQLNTYTFLIGLGMRESTGKYCSGRDKSKDFIKGSNAEAGLFQMAYVARVFNSEMAGLYDDFKSGKRSCELGVFHSDKIKNKCTIYDAKNHGNDEGTKWQALMKRCPAFSTQWAALLVRSQYRHFGPIIRKEVEYKTACRDMLQKVENVAIKSCSQFK